MKIAIQGESASFHEEAAQRFFDQDVTTIACESFSDVFGALNRHEAAAGVVAIENSLYGSINQVYDLIESHAYPVIGEVSLPIHQQLIGRVNTKITHIYSHPVALAQCENFLETHYPDAERIEYFDTAGAVRFIKESDNPHYAAIANIQAAALYELPVIEHDIEDNPANITRFLVVMPGGTPPRSANRSSLVLTTNHIPGALAKILTTFADRNINLSKLQSRPIIGRPWHYRFYLVVDTAGKPLHDAINALSPFTDSITILGEYHSASV